MHRLCAFLIILIFSFSAYSQSVKRLESITENRAELASTSYRYKTNILSSNFSNPVVKFSRFDNPITGAIGDVSFFNSVGAGLSIAAGEIAEVRDESGKIINQKFTSTLGATIGILPETYKRSFLTLSYNIPVYKLKRGSFYILRSGNFIDDSSFGNKETRKLINHYC